MVRIRCKSSPIREATLSICLGVCLLPEALLAAQAPSFRVETRLVEVPVLVRERKSGRPLEGLTVSDFVVLEGGKPQKIEFFHVYRTGSGLESAAKLRGLPPSGPASATAGRSPGGTSGNGW